MKPGFYTIIAAQFVSSLADNALLIAAIAILSVIHSSPWVTPLLQIFFTISYVLLAPFVGAFADAMQKRHVMFVSNALKAGGCLMMIMGVHPMIAYGVVGFGAAAYSPAKYGILTELLPPAQLVKANAWLESATVLSTIVGTMLGGALISTVASHIVARLHLPIIHTAADLAMLAVMITYAAAAAINIWIPDTGARYENRLKEPGKLVGEFANCFHVLWMDKLAQIALWVTTLMWGGAVTMQLLVLKWADANLGLSLSKAAVMQGVTGIGIAVGASAAAAWVPLRSGLKVLPIGILTGAVAVAMSFYSKGLFPAGSGIRVGPLFAPFYIVFAYPLMIILGSLSGFFIVPMNAVLQHRGATLLSAGHSIAVQNFNQNLAVLLMLGAYAILLTAKIPVQWIIVVFGSFITVMMWLAKRRRAANERSVDMHAMVE
ncbi:lysophospholipid transporter LplT [Paraburkholderia phosphatilytica]|uniref:lysophospholipid transporter LplT n=1 Tax=Paraburkholderia phosphatilytica TaxID=2282883 RepID=UPI000E4CA35D|nr:lysophospholipid transporter LplT [Paraburkholderia phosphatilytica]